jgi:hypothetical protein
MARLPVVPRNPNRGNRVFSPEARLEGLRLDGRLEPTLDRDKLPAGGPVRVPHFSRPFARSGVGHAGPDSLPRRRFLNIFKLINLHRPLRKPRRDLQLSTHCFDKALQRAHVHIRTPLQL